MSTIARAELREDCTGYRAYSILVSIREGGWARDAAGRIRTFSTKTSAQQAAEKYNDTMEAISLAKSQINDGGMDDANAIDAACEHYKQANRDAVVKAIAGWK